MNKNHLAAVCWGLCALLPLHAQVQVTVQAPSEVIEGDRFRVSYVVNTQDVEDFKVDAFEGLIELYGPSQSSSSSYSIVNGRTTSSSTITFTYTVTSEKAGSFKLPVASVVSGGKTYKSTARQITVLPAGNGGSSNQNGGGQTQSRGSNSTRMHTSEVGEKISGKDIFIAVTASKKHVFEQEAVLLTYKLYTLVNVSEMSGKMPELDGFHVQQLNREQQPQLKMEHYNGRNYGTVVWCQYVVFPQHAGMLKIPEIKFDATIIQQERAIDPFEAFFGGGSMMREVHKTVMAPAVTLQVDALPTPKPENFSGAVGKFSMISSLAPLSLKTNDATTLRVNIKGVGNMKLMKSPEVAWPKDFEQYDPKTEDKTSISTAGSSGSVIFDFIAVPRHQGKYEIPAVKFCYFDPDTKSYKTLTGDAYTMEVAKGKGGSPQGGTSLSKEEIEMLNNDIHFIKTGEATYQTGGTTFFHSARYWGIYAVLFLIFIVTIGVFRRQAIANTDIARKRGKGASKAATKRLKTARALLQSNNVTAFYEEAMKALWGYISDKENIPLSELTKENVQEKLTNCEVAPSLIDEFLQTIDACEFARFAPGDPAENMEKIYTSAETIINKMENTLKSAPKSAPRLALALAMAMVITPLYANVDADAKADADSAYIHEHYAEAAKKYLQLVTDSAESATIYYNIGNCYYRMDSIAKAILYYEKARLLNPADKEIRSNLELARMKTVDKVAPANEMFFVTFFRTLMLSMSIQGWAWMGITMFVILLLGIAAYLFLPSLLGKKIGFSLAIVALVVCIFANIAAFELRSHIEHRTGAVVMAASVVVKSTPSAAGLDLFILHEGTTIRILDDTMRDWVEIHLSDGKEGWVPRADISRI